MADEIEKLAVGLAADHQADKVKKNAKPAKAGAKAEADATAAGSSPDEAAALGTVVADAVKDATGGTEAGDQGTDEKPSIMAERIENITAEADIETKTLVGDLLATLLDLFKTRPKPWSQMPEDDQTQVVIALRNAATDLVGNAVRLIANAGDGAFTAKLEQYADKGALKIALTAESTTDNVLACHAAQGQFVVVKRFDTRPFSSERREVYTDPDQPAMAFDKDADQPPKRDISDDDLADPFGDDKDGDRKDKDEGNAPFGVFDADEGDWLSDATLGDDKWSKFVAEAVRFTKDDADAIVDTFSGNIVVKPLP